MTLGKTLWKVVIFKILILLILFKLIFFNETLYTKFNNDESRSNFVQNNLIKENK